MDWTQLLAKPEVRAHLWTGGRELLTRDRRYVIAGELPHEHGWHRFTLSGSRKARWDGAGAPDPDIEARGARVSGYLVGDRLIPDGASFVQEAARILDIAPSVYLLEDGLERFSRVEVVRLPDGRHIYLRPGFPFGPEADVLDAYADRKPDLRGVPGVPPSLNLAFRLESYLRAERERLRREAEERLLAEQRRQEEEQRRQAEARRQEEASRQVMTTLGDGASRRNLAKHDFEAAARAALALSGAQLIDHHPAPRRGEMVVKFRFAGRRFECVCSAQTLGILDAGICLSANGVRGDTFFTLESLPAVIQEAIDSGVLVVLRRV